MITGTDTFFIKRRPDEEIIDGAHFDHARIISMH